MNKLVETEETRQERREKRRRKKQEKMPQHGRSLARVYKNAVLKRASASEKQGGKGEKVPKSGEKGG